MVTNLIVAVDFKTNGIGVNGQIPWNIKDDMKWFKNMTTGNTVIMGRKTYESLGKPLKNRLNIIISKSWTPDCDLNENVRIASSAEEALQIAENEKFGMIFVIGGASIYKEFLSKNLIDNIYIDYIHNEVKYEYDTFFPYTRADLVYSRSYIESSIDVTPNDMDSRCMCKAFFKTKTCNAHDERYIDMLNDIYHNGNVKHTRAGETLSIFPYHMSFDLQKGLPILTTKKVFAKGCIHELLWFLKGGDNIKYLVDNNVHIWDDDAYRHYTELVKKHNEQCKPGELAHHLFSKEEFLDVVKIAKKTVFNIDGTVKQYTYGDLGPVYGKQWTDCNGVNQVNELIDKLKNNPDDRRLIISSWNVSEIKDMALPPCHYMSQWYTTELSFDERVSAYCKMAGDDAKCAADENYMTKIMDKMNVPKYKLSCMWSQRSVDSCLGFPYDLLSYSILTHMIAQVTNMVPDKVHCILGDTHIYKNQLDDAYLQMVRNPYLFEYPTLKLNKDITDIYDFKYEDIKIEGYQSYPAIKYKLSVGL